VDDGFDFPATAHSSRELFTACLFVLLVLALLVWGGWKLISLISAPRRAPRSILGAQAFSHFATAVLWPVGHAPPFANQGLNRLLRGRLLRAQTVAFRLRPQSGAHLLQTVRKVQDLGLEWRKEGAGRNFGRFRSIGRLMRPERASGRPHARG
jgi:hypothetical protein